MSRNDPEPARRGLSENLPQAPDDLALEVLELEGPGRGAGVDVKGPVPPKTGRPRITGDRFAHRLGPRADEIGHRTRCAEAAELTTDGIADPIHQAACAVLVPSLDCATSSVCAGSPGSELRL
ncbi:MAG TPA: hypothetical protein VK287_05330, partial [Gaiellaceae bacterium]|nr:hypothetical protein [Gaiellaceae bacterium]